MREFVYTYLNPFLGHDCQLLLQVSILARHFQLAIGNLVSLYALARIFFGGKSFSTSPLLSSTGGRTRFEISVILSIFSQFYRLHFS